MPNALSSTAGRAMFRDAHPNLPNSKRMQQGNLEDFWQCLAEFHSGNDLIARVGVNLAFDPVHIGFDLMVYIGQREVVRGGTIQIGIVMQKTMLRLAQRHLALPQPVAFHDEVRQACIDDQEQGLGIDTAENQVFVLWRCREDAVQQQYPARRQPLVDVAMPFLRRKTVPELHAVSVGIGIGQMP